MLEVYSYKHLIFYVAVPELECVDKYLLISVVWDFMKPRATMCPVFFVDVRIFDPTISVWEGFLKLKKFLDFFTTCYFLMLSCIWGTKKICFKKYWIMLCYHWLSQRVKTNEFSSWPLECLRKLWWGNSE